MQERPSLIDPPLVSAVIPTRGRPRLLVCAVRSALRQKYPALEVIVVIDGNDAETAARLDSITDPRLRVVLLPERSGGSAARNAGVRAARGEWIAFLDDDDEWLPEKLDRQMRIVQQTSVWFPVISCRLIAQSPSASRVLPLRVYDPSQPVPDYLFCRTGFSDPGGLLQTSTLLAPRDLLLAVPFREGLPMHQDWDWILRVSSHEGVKVFMAVQPLTIWRVEGERSSTGREPNWQFSFAWICENRKLLSRRAFSAFIAVQCAWRAQQGHAGMLARLQLLRGFLVDGAPDWISAAHFFFFGFLPASLRRSLRDRFLRNPDYPAGASGLSLVASRSSAPAALTKAHL